jgi:hypothetical protein
MAINKNYEDFVGKYRENAHRNQIKELDDLIKYAQTKFKIKKLLPPNFKVYTVEWEDTQPASTPKYHYIFKEDMIKYIGNNHDSPKILFIYGANWNFIKGGSQAASVETGNAYSQNMAGIRTTKLNHENKHIDNKGQFNGICIDEKVAKAIISNDENYYKGINESQLIYLFSIIDIDIQFIKYKIIKQNYTGIVFMNGIGKGAANLQTEVKNLDKYIENSIKKLKLKLSKNNTENYTIKLPIKNKQDDPDAQNVMYQSISHAI